MKSKPISSLLISSHLAFFFAVCGPAVAEKPPRKTETGRVPYDFDQPEANEGWRIVTDGVMGGMSSSKLTISDGGLATFSGELSLENNGGFASVRSNLGKLELKLPKCSTWQVKTKLYRPKSANNPYKPEATRCLTV